MMYIQLLALKIAFTVVTSVAMETSLTAWPGLGRVVIAQGTMKRWGQA